jgi:outer membrane protein OmpA-like peptidoglycan-associated protein
VPPPGFRQPKSPGPVGLSHPSQTEATSVFKEWPPPAYTQSTETICATIYFKTNESEISGADDLTALNTVGRILQYLEYAGHEFTCVCRGHADIRGSETYNLTLSLDRAASVKRELDKWLPPPKGATERVSTEGLGRGLLKESRYWAEARRVDVIVRRQATRLQHATLGFEVATDHDVEWVFSLGLQKLELNKGGHLMAWLPSEFDATYEESLGRGRLAVFQQLNLTRADYVTDMRSKVTAYVRLRYDFVGHRNVHRVTAQVLDAVSNVPIGPPESVEAPELIDVNDTWYLSSAPEEERQIWRRLQAGHRPPPGVPVETRSGLPTGLTALVGEVHRKLCFVHPTITARVAQAAGVPRGAP